MHGRILVAADLACCLPALPGYHHGDILLEAGDVPLAQFWCDLCVPEMLDALYQVLLGECLHIPLNVALQLGP